MYPLIYHPLHFQGGSHCDEHQWPETQTGQVTQNHPGRGERKPLKIKHERYSNCMSDMWSKGKDLRSVWLIQGNTILTEAARDSLSDPPHSHSPSETFHHFPLCGWDNSRWSQTQVSSYFFPSCRTSPSLSVPCFAPDTTLISGNIMKKDPLAPFPLVNRLSDIS